MSILAGRSIARLVGRRRLIGHSHAAGDTNQPIGRTIERLIGCLVGRLIGCLVGRLIGMPIIAGMLI